MTTPATPQNPFPKTFENTGIWLPGLAVDSLRQGQLVLDGYTFRNCSIDGPAVIAVVNTVGFLNCDFGLIGSVRDLMFAPQGENLVGAIGFLNSTFEGCRFDMVGFTGNEDFLRDLERHVATTPIDSEQA